MTKIVVDSSVIVKWLNSQDENYLKQADQLLLDCEKGKIGLYSPELAKYEVGNALLSKKMALPQTKSSLATLFSLPITFVPLDKESAIDAYNFSEELKITYYDSSFLILAQKIKATLVTDNPKHQKSTEKIKVMPLKDYSK